MSTAPKIWCNYDHCCEFVPGSHNGKYCPEHNCKRLAENSRRRLEEPLVSNEELWERQEQRKLGRMEVLQNKNQWLLEKSRIGFFDLETTNLNASIGMILCGCVKEYKGETKDWVAKTNESTGLMGDKDICIQMRDYLEDLDYVSTFYGCPAPGELVLTADLQWVPAEKIEPGQELLGFDAEAEENKRRKWQRATAKTAPAIVTDIWEVMFDDGSSTTVSGDHPWLCGGSPSYYWVKTRNLNYLDKGPTPIKRLITPWGMPTDKYAAGWLAGFFDGEGTLSHCHGLGVSATQQEGAALEQAKDMLTRLGFQWGANHYDRNQKHMTALRIAGGVPEVMRFLGQVRPVRLLENFGKANLPSIKAKKETRHIVGAAYVGRGPVIGLSTTSETYILNGFGAHNTGFDIPYINTRLIMHNERPIAKLRHVDLYYVARTHLKLHSNRLAVVAETLFGDSEKTRVIGPTWTRAMQGSEEDMEYIVEHCRKDVVELEQVFETLRGFINLSVKRWRKYGGSY